MHYFLPVHCGAPDMANKKQKKINLNDNNYLFDNNNYLFDNNNSSIINCIIYASETVKKLSMLQINSIRKVSEVIAHASSASPT